MSYILVYAIKASWTHLWPFGKSKNIVIHFVISSWIGVVVFLLPFSFGFFVVFTFSIQSTKKILSSHSFTVKVRRHYIMWTELLLFQIWDDRNVNVVFRNEARGDRIQSLNESDVSELSFKILLSKKLIEFLHRPTFFCYAISLSISTKNRSPHRSRLSAI